MNLLQGGSRHRLTEAAFWYGYLLVLVMLSFTTQRYDTPAWLFLSTGFYFFFAAYIVTVGFGLRCNWAAIGRAKLVLICWVLMLGWLFLQTVIPADQAHFLTHIQSLDAPLWFNPATKLSVEPERTRWLLFTDTLVFSLFVLSLALLDSRRRVQQLLILLLLIGCFHAVAGIMALKLKIFFVDIAQLDGHYRVVRGWFVNRNHFAAFLNLTLIGGIAYVVNQSFSGRNDSFAISILNQVLSPRVLYLAGVLIILVAIIMSQSRGGLASILSVLIVLLIVTRWNDSRIKQNVQIAVSIFVFAGGLMLYFGQELLARLTQESFSLGERVVQWQITWQAIKESPMLGYGGGSYATVFQIFREYTDLRQVVFNQSHNHFLHLWLEQGLLGLFLWFALLVLTFRHSLISIRRTRSTFVSSVSLSAMAVMAAAVLQSGVDFNLQIVNIRCYFFVIIALIFATPCIRHQTRGQRKKNKRIDQTHSRVKHHE